MSIDTLGAGGLDYFPCRYPESRLTYRGPRRDLSSPYAAFVGGTLTYGKFVDRPFPDLVEDKLGMTCVNFGSMNAGVDVFLYDPFLKRAVNNARITVIQITSPRNMSNRFYSVHPRRNDRFLKPSTVLQTIYKDVDFSEFNFTKHMLQRLRDVSPERFMSVVEELQQAWRARMQFLLSEIPGKTVLLWLSDHEPGDGTECSGRDPWFVSSDLIEEIRPNATAYVQAVASKEAIAAGTDGMFHSEMEEPAARHILGPVAHHEVADHLVPVMEKLL
jgi:hypothetical protein